MRRKVVLLTSSDIRKQDNDTIKCPDNTFNTNEELKQDNTQSVNERIINYNPHKNIINFYYSKKYKLIKTYHQVISEGLTPIPKDI
jgi:hypothetical protein